MERINRNQAAGTERRQFIITSKGAELIDSISILMIVFSFSF